MTIIKNIFKAVCSVALLSALSACDKVAENERYIEAEIPAVGRKILVEEFTGQLCINCPDGHEAMSNIKSLLKENVIAVSIHAGHLALDTPGYGLKTPDGDTYANAWGVQAYPCIVVNRQGNIVNNIPQWQDAVMQQMGQTADVDIELKATVNEGGELKIESKMLPKKDIKAKYQLWITESNITAVQMKLDGSIDNGYVHNHVYRASVNGVGGEEISLQSGVYSNLTSTMTLNSSWKKDNLSVVAFIYDETGVIQAEEVSLGSTSHE